ncbi:MAG: TetR/AcrR family transcriptional regulator [Ktedonobacteraceae bacterium]|nr:TetR/AcrR family transcriptional regulator [Ktedonobacteraceae bacterium]
MSQSTPEPGDGIAGNVRPDLLAGQHFPPPPQQERSRRKRDALLEAALALFAEKGYEATSIEEIAHRAGVAVGGFYQHFASKRQLLLVLMNRLLDEVESLPAQLSPDQLDYPRAVIEQVVRQGLLTDWAYVGAYRAWREAVVQERELQALHVSIEEWTAWRIEMMLRAMQQGPGARSDVDLVTMAAIVSLLFWRLAETPLDEPDAVIASITDLIYHALFT